MGLLRPDGHPELSGASKAALTAVFFLSGLVSLVYEVVWARLLAVHLGSTTEGHTVAIATFMGGLGLGYAWLGPKADKVANPLRLYAALEVGIAGWAWGFPWIVDATASLLGGGVLLAVVAVLVPTTLMGGTLPALTAAMARRDAPGSTIASLYGVNALGAALGVFVAGFWGVEALGVRGTGWAAAGLNTALALVAWWLSRGGTRPPDGPQVVTASGRLLGWAAGAACVVGLVSMALQGAWIRLFAVVLGSSTYSFSLVIGVYIAGMALGSLVVYRWSDRLPPLATLAGLATTAALVLWLTSPGFEALPFQLAGLREAAGATGASFGAYTAWRLTLVATLIVLPTLAFGATLPLAARVAAVGRPGAGTGAVFAFNTLGAVLGAATSLPLLVPLLGLDGVHQAGATVLAALGLALGVVSGGRRARWGLVGLSLVALLGPLVVPVSWDPRELSAGAFRMRERKADTREAFRARLHRSELLFHADGPDATVAVLGREGERVLTVNGKPDASTRGDMVTQVTSAHVPLILHGDPKTALVVGLGSGVTVGSALHHPGLVVDVVEVSRAVVDASRLFDHISGAPLDDPRVHLSVDDVRSDLRRRPEARWDVIVSEPSNPWVAGNAGLFSVEFFSLLARHLSPEGVAAQWVQRYETDDASLKMVIRSFAQAFAHVEVWQLYPTDLLLVGRQSAPRADLPRMQQRAQTPTIAADLERVGLPGLHGLLSLQAMSAAGVADLLAPPGPVHTDDHPRLEFEGPRRLYAGARSSLIAEHDVRVGRSQPGTWRMPLLGPPPVGVLEQLFVFHTTYPGAPPAWRLGFVPRLVSESDRAFLVDLLFTLAEEARWAQVAPVADRLLSIAPDDPRALYVVARARHAHLVAMGTDSGSPQWSAIAALVARCIDLGDEPRRRCARLSGRL